MNHQGNLSLQTPEAHVSAPILPMTQISPVGNLSRQHRVCMLQNCPSGFPSPVTSEPQSVQQSLLVKQFCLFSTHLNQPHTSMPGIVLSPGFVNADPIPWGRPRSPATTRSSSRIPAVILRLLQRA